MTHLAAFALGVTTGTVAALFLIARRGAPAPQVNDAMDRYMDGDYMCPNCVTPWKCNGPHLYSDRPTDDWATDPRTAELATGGGQEGAE